MFRYRFATVSLPIFGFQGRGVPVLWELLYVDIARVVFRALSQPVRQTECPRPNKMRTFTLRAKVQVWSGVE